VIILSHRAWRNKLGGDPEIVGKRIMVRGHLLKVVGIVQAGFAGLGEAPRDFWVPVTMAGQLEDGPDLFGASYPNRLRIVGRLKDDLTYRQAEAVLEVWARNSTNGRNEDEKAVGIVLESQATSVHLNPQLIATTMPVFVAFLLVLLIACSNIASMMLARALARQREIGVRLALGAARIRLLRQLLTESLVLAVPSAIAGLVLSEAALHFGQNALMAAMPSDLAQVITITSLQPDVARIWIPAPGRGSFGDPLWTCPCTSGHSPGRGPGDKGRIQGGRATSQIPQCPDTWANRGLRDVAYVQGAIPSRQRSHGRAGRWFRDQWYFGTQRKRKVSVEGFIATCGGAVSTCDRCCAIDSAEWKVGVSSRHRGRATHRSGCLQFRLSRFLPGSRHFYPKWTQLLPDGSPIRGSSGHREPEDG